MKKSILFVILVTLTLVIALSGTGLAFAEEAGADAADAVPFCGFHIALDVVRHDPAQIKDFCVIRNRFFRLCKRTDRQTDRFAQQFGILFRAAGIRLI